MELDSPTSPDCCQHIAKRPTPATVQLQASVSFEFELHGRAQLVLSPVRECDDNSTEPDSCTKSQPSGGLMPTPQRVKSDGCFAIRRPKSPLPYPGSISFEGLNCQSPVLLSPVRSPAAVVRRLPLGAQSPSQRNMNPFSPAVGKHGCALTFPGESLSGSGSRYVDDFEQLAQIGEGSFGTVFKCRKRVDGCVYAVKVTRKQMRSEVQRQEMLREVFALSAVSQSARRESTHIVRYFNAWWEEGRLYIQTELCSHSLEDVVERAAGPLPSDTCVLVLEHMLLGLSLIHNAGMCHLDVKPANIFVSGAEEIVYKLGDLGLATLDQNALDVIEGDSKYLPRELLLEDFSNLPMADIYSLGATVLEMALGRPLPGSGPEWQQIRDGHLPMAELAGVGEELKSVLRWMMHPDQLQRPTTEEVLRHPLFRSEMELLLHQERALSNGLQEKLAQVMEKKAKGIYELKRTSTV